MNQTLRELRAIADRERARFLPEVTDQDLEKKRCAFLYERTKRDRV